VGRKDKVVLLTLGPQPGIERRLNAEFTSAELEERQLAKESDLLLLGEPLLARENVLERLQRLGDSNAERHSTHKKVNDIRDDVVGLEAITCRIDRQLEPRP